MIKQISAVPEWVWIGAALAGAAFLMRPRQVANGAVSFAGEVIGGLAEGVGSAVQEVANKTLGVPKTDDEKCIAASKSGDVFDSLAYCGLINDFGQIATSVNVGIGNVVQSAGTKIGIPKTDKTRCAKARAEGDFWDTLAYCAVIDDLIFGNSPAKTTVPVKPKEKATAPGGGFITDSGPSFSDVINDPYGIGTGMGSYFFMDMSTETERERRTRDVTPVAGIRG